MSDEMDYIVTHKKRLSFITNLLGNVKGNVLVLYQFVEKDIKPLYDTIKEKYKNRNVFCKWFC